MLLFNNDNYSRLRPKTLSLCSSHVALSLRSGRLTGILRFTSLRSLIQIEFSSLISALFRSLASSEKILSSVRFFQLLISFQREKSSRGEFFRGLAHFTRKSRKIQLRKIP